MSVTEWNLDGRKLSLSHYCMSERAACKEKKCLQLLIQQIKLNGNGFLRGKKDRFGNIDSVVAWAQFYKENKSFLLRKKEKFTFLKETFFCSFIKKRENKIKVLNFTFTFLYKTHSFIFPLKSKIKVFFKKEKFSFSFSMISLKAKKIKLLFFKEKFYFIFKRKVWKKEKENFYLKKSAL